jgi:8-oxo-dGTP pyrophosphatase MutT (NUDIX family)
MFKPLPNNAARSLTGWGVSFETPWFSMLTRDTWHLVTPTSRRNGGAVFAIDSHNRVLLLEVYRPAVDEVCLEIPRGMAESNEEISETAAREFNEETGISCTPDQLVSMGDFFPDTGILAHRIALFSYKLDTPFPDIHVETTEALSHRLIPLDQLETMILNGLIADAITITAAARFKHNAMEIPDGAAGIEKEIEILDNDGKAVVSMRTKRPDWACEQFASYEGREDLTWRFAVPD